MYYGLASSGNSSSREVARQEGEKASIFSLLESNLRFIALDSDLKLRKWQLEVCNEAQIPWPLFDSSNWWMLCFSVTF